MNNGNTNSISTNVINYTEGSKRKIINYILLALTGGIFAWILPIIIDFTMLSVMGYSSWAELIVDLRNMRLFTLNSISIYSCIREIILKGLFCSAISYFISFPELKLNYPQKKAIAKSFAFLGIGFIIGGVMEYIYLLIPGYWLAQLTSRYMHSDTFIPVIYQILIFGLGYSIIGIGIACTVSLSRKKRKYIISHIVIGFISGLVSGVLYSTLFTSSANDYQSFSLIESNNLIKLIMSLIFSLLVGVGIYLFNVNKDKQVNIK